jgi:hypothetical protein
MLVISKICSLLRARNVPLGIVTEKDGQRSVDNTPLLSERTTHIDLDTSKPFKLNAGSAGVCASFSVISLVSSFLIKIVYRSSIVHA